MEESNLPVFQARMREERWDKIFDDVPARHLDTNASGK
jgi:hypothetical protein